MQSSHLSQSACCLHGQCLSLNGNTEQSAAFYTYSASLYYFLTPLALLDGFDTAQHSLQLTQFHPRNS